MESVIFPSLSLMNLSPSPDFCSLCCQIVYWSAPLQMTHQQLREPGISAKPFPQLCNSNLCPHLLGTLTVFLTPPISFPPVNPNCGGTSEWGHSVLTGFAVFFPSWLTWAQPLHRACDLQCISPLRSYCRLRQLLHPILCFLCMTPQPLRFPDAFDFF